MVAVSLSYKKVPRETREKFAFGDEETKAFLESLRLDGSKQAVFLSTCNRCEVYADISIHKVISRLCLFANVPGERIKSDVLIYEGREAVRHLFCVCCGLDSMVLGEDEILGQVKRAFAFSVENGFTGYEFNTVFKAAVTSAKKIKTETKLSKTSVSVATLAAAQCHRAKRTSNKVLLVGAGGDIGGKTMKNLISYGEFEIYVTSREKHISQKGVTVISYDDRYSYADEADIIISATRSPHYIFTYEKLRNNIKTEKPRLFVDLAVPSDIDRDIAKLQGARLLSIDDFEKTAKENCSIKEKEVVFAKEIMEGYVDELCKDMLFHEKIDFLKETFTESELGFIYKFRDSANIKQLESFFDVIENLKSRQ